MSTVIKHFTRAELEAGLDLVRQSPRDAGTLELIVRRPAVEQRETLESGELTPTEGLVGDSWRRRHGDHSLDPRTQITLMNARAASLVAADRSRWALAGDQLFVDFDLSGENLPPGTQLTIGSAVLEVSDEPHRGCAKFVSRFGLDAMKFVNSPVGRELNLRGIYVLVVRAGTVRVGDEVRKLVRSVVPSAT